MNVNRGRRSFVFALLAGTLSAGMSFAQEPAAPPADGTPLKVMTFNIRCPAKDDGPNYWDYRVELAAGVVKEHSPDIVGLQEALRRQLDDLQPHLGDYVAIGAGRDDGKDKGEFSAILYNKNILEPLDSGTFWLSDTPEVPGSITWGANLPRVCTWGRFKHKASGKTFYFFNTHWDHESANSRAKSARLMAARVAKRENAGDPAIVTGDFNTGESSEPIRYLTAEETGSPVRLTDVFRTLHPDRPLNECGTYHAWSGKTTGPRIDFILTTPGVKAEASEILHDRKDGRLPSDHFPVTATLRLK